MSCLQTVDFDLSPPIILSRLGNNEKSDGMEFGGAVVFGVMLAIPLSFIILPFTPDGAEHIRKAELQRKESEYQQRLAVDAAVTNSVASCLTTLGPWKCFGQLSDLDKTDPVSFGHPRTERLAAISSAQDVLLFCDLPRKVDCANQMIGQGYDAGEVAAALRSQP
jgi:hypothetical protein